MDFFRNETTDAFDNGYQIGLKAGIALDILKTHPLIVARLDGEDSAGRQKLRDASVTEVIEQVIALADAFVDRAAGLGWIKATTMPPEEAAVALGEQRGLIEKAQYGASLGARVKAVSDEIAARRTRTPAA